MPLPGRRRIGLELARGPSVESVRLSWDLLRDRHGELLNELAPRYRVTSAAGNERFRLIAGPLLSPQKAGQLCDALKAEKYSCEVTVFSGDAL